MLAITICATKNYSYAMRAQARRILASIPSFEKVSGIREGLIILSGDESNQLLEVKNFYATHLSSNWKVRLLGHNIDDTGKLNYKNEAQLIISQLRTSAFTEARAEKADYCFSLDSDVLPPPNGLSCLWQTLQWDEGYYSVSQGVYFSQGGGGLMGGRGTPQHQICPDFYEDEREIPKELQKRIADHKETLKKFQKDKKQPSEDWVKTSKKLDDEVKACSPIGNIFYVNSKKWRKRGWMEQAYPAIGKGAIVPIDWCGFGATLMNKKALDLAFFDGYSGAGTEDLYICWNRWYQNNIRLAAVPHILCDHIIRDRKKDGEQIHGQKYIHLQPYHETEGECVGHVRMKSVPWYGQDIGEVYNKDNDGKLSINSIENFSKKEIDEKM